MSSKWKKKEDLTFKEFEWDNSKRKINIEKHSIDFEDAIFIFCDPFILKRSDQKQEERFLAVGSLEDLLISIVFTEREGRCRVISARRARNNEREAYHKAFPSGP